MWMVVLGVLFCALKLAGIVPVAHWPWFVVLLPFGLAAAWWAWADASGLTQRRARDALDKKKEARRQRALESLGQANRPDRRGRH